MDSPGPAGEGTDLRRRIFREVAGRLPHLVHLPSPCGLVACASTCVDPMGPLLPLPLVGGGEQRPFLLLPPWLGCGPQRYPFLAPPLGFVREGERGWRPPVRSPTSVDFHLHVVRVHSALRRRPQPRWRTTTTRPSSRPTRVRPRPSRSRPDKCARTGSLSSKVDLARCVEARDTGEGRTKTRRASDQARSVRPDRRAEARAKSDSWNGRELGNARDSNGRGITGPRGSRTTLLRLRCLIRLFSSVCRWSMSPHPKRASTATQNAIS